MTYYEQLGIKSDATTEEIRHAYKLMALLLHPDKQTDPKLRELADSQMRRLGEAVATLCDPAKRIVYDAEVLGGNRQIIRAPWLAPIPEPDAEWLQWVKLAAKNWFWILLGAMMAGVAAWSMAVRQPDVIHEVRTESTPTGRVEKAVRPAATEKPAVGGTAHPLSTKTVRPEPEPLPPFVPAMESRAIEEAKPREFARPELPDLPPPPGLMAAREPGLAGNWLFTPGAEEKASRGQYPAYYVELMLQANQGSLGGHYRSRHRVSDRAISPEVRLEVEGRNGAEKTASLRWTSAGGAKGEMEVTLRTPNVLDVRWWTTEFGRTVELSSGTATLIRQVAP